MNDMFSIDSVVATRRGSCFSIYRGLKPTAKVMRLRRGQDIADLTATVELACELILSALGKTIL